MCSSARPHTLSPSQLSKNRTSASRLHSGLHKQAFVWYGFVFSWVRVLKSHMDPNWKHQERAMDYLHWTDAVVPWHADAHGGGHMLT